MKITTAAYDVYGKLQEEQEYEAVSSFQVDSTTPSDSNTSQIFPESVVLGIWVSDLLGENPNAIVPIYLTKEQQALLIAKGNQS